MEGRGRREGRKGGQEGRKGKETVEDSHGGERTEEEREIEGRESGLGRVTKERRGKEGSKRNTAGFYHVFISAG